MLIIIQIKKLHYRILKDRKIIDESLQRIRDSIDYNEQLKIAKNEAKRIKKLGYDAYLVKAIGNRKAIVFLNYPKPIRWLTFDK